MENLNAFIRKTTLNISVDNFDDLKILIQNIKNKQDELSDAVNQLNNFNLAISFNQTKNVEINKEQKVTYRKIGLEFKTNSEDITEEINTNIEGVALSKLISEMSATLISSANNLLRKENTTTNDSDVFLQRELIETSSILNSLAQKCLKLNQ